MRRNLAFDATRGFAAFAVLAYHIGHAVGLPLFASGYLAVDFFFILSGYVLQKAYAQRLESDLSFVAFVRLRLVRLYPLFAMGVALGIARALGAIAIGDPRAPSVPELAQQTVLNALMLPAQIGSDGIFPLNTPAWSLSLEMAINLVFAAVLFRASRRWLVAICVAGAVGIGFAATQFDSLDQGWNLSSYWVGVCRVAFGFTMGLWLARLNMVHSARFALLVPVILLFVLAMPRGNIPAAYDVLIVLVIFPVMIVAMEGAVITGPLRTLFTWLGDISYPLYAVHYPLLIPIGLVVKRLHFGPWIAAAVMFLGAIVAAMIAAHLDRLIRKRLQSPPDQGMKRRAVA
ncbi:hypothetical protein S2M10_30180 [Sphingomonas sp. S2M10]|nr:hypothetical protein [Sphingomonas sp. S2M10]